MSQLHYPALHAQLETLAQAIVAGQKRYQRHTPLFDQLLHLLVEGRPLSPERLARALQRSVDEVRAILGEHPELEYDAHGDIVGSGLTLLPTPHQFQVADRMLFTWCAMDTLSYPVRVTLTARVTSRCPVTGSAIRLTVTPEQALDLDPPGAMVSLVIPEAAEATVCCHNVREDVCHYGHFLVSSEAATQWAATHPHAVILPVAEAYQVGVLVEGYHALARQYP
jgi:alkylmercury lyase